MLTVQFLEPLSTLLSAEDRCELLPEQVLSNNTLSVLSVSGVLNFSPYPHNDYYQPVDQPGKGLSKGLGCGPPDFNCHSLP